MSLAPGSRVGEWTILSEGTKRGAHRYWKCRCSCGVERLVKQSSVVSGASRSCGHTRPLKHNATMAAAFTGRAGP